MPNCCFQPIVDWVTLPLPDDQGAWQKRGSGSGKGGLQSASQCLIEKRN